MLKVHYDESYDEGVYVVGGYIADADTWENVFEPRWEAMLKREPAIPSFHMTDLMYPPSQSAFGKLTHEQRDDRIREAIEIVRESRLRPIGVVFDHKALGGCKKHPKLKKHFNGIWLAAALRGAIRERKKAKSEDKILVFFDRLASKKDELNIFSLYEAWIKAIEPDEVDVFPSYPTFETRFNIIPLQCADLLAWYIRRRFIPKFANDDLATLLLENVQVAVCTREIATEMLSTLRVAELMAAIPGKMPTADEVLRVTKMVRHDLEKAGLI